MMAVKPFLWRYPSMRLFDEGTPHPGEPEYRFLFLNGINTAADLRESGGSVYGASWV